MKKALLIVFDIAMMAASFTGCTVGAQKSKHQAVMLATVELRLPA